MFDKNATSRLDLTLLWVRAEWRLLAINAGSSSGLVLNVAAAADDACQ